MSMVASLVYADRLNEPPIYPTDPDAIEEVVARYSDILGDHLDLGAVILSAAAGMLDVDPEQLLDRIVAERLGGYD
ncbi:hypothetical protein AB0H43_22185 [Hamadaea sp. NPDC050747]|uniref:hypothetical protein n=1 Tax=Hamadaea sp. NPDC050747 TaxID=3155789 RepID=UPI0033F8F373